MIKADVLREGLRDTPDLRRIGRWALSSASLVFNAPEEGEGDGAKDGPRLPIVPHQLFLKAEDVTVDIFLNPASPYQIREEGEGRYFLCRGEEPLEEVSFLPRPAYFSRATRDGTPLGTLALQRGPSCITVCPFNYCEYTGRGEPCLYCCVYPSWDNARKQFGARTAPRLEALRGEGPFSQKAWELTNLCMACLSCRPSCPAGLPTPLLATLLKAEGVQRGMKAPAAYDTFFPKNKFFVTDLMLALQLKPQDVPWIEAVPPDPPAADTVLFLGCYNHIQADKILTTLDVLKALKLEFVPLVGDPRTCCCGAIFTLVGDTQGAEEKARALMEAVSAFRPKRLLFWCVGCSWWHREVNAHFLGEPPFEAQNVIALLGQAMGIEHEDRLKKYRSLNDPQKILEAAREFIEASPFTVAEMEQIVPRIFRKR